MKRGVIYPNNLQEKIVFLVYKKIPVNHLKVKKDYKLSKQDYSDRNMKLIILHMSVFSRQV